MTRKTARQIAVQLLFSMETNALSPDEAADLFFSEEHYSSLQEEDHSFEEEADKKSEAYIRRLIESVSVHQAELDEIIGRYARDWKTNRLSTATRTILRVCLCEILYFDDVPDSAAVNEAVELGKTFDSPEAASFINGVLGSFLRTEKPEKAK